MQRPQMNNRAKTYLHGQRSVGIHRDTVGVVSGFLNNAVYNGREISEPQQARGRSPFISLILPAVGQATRQMPSADQQLSLSCHIWACIQLYYNNRFYGLPWVLKETGIGASPSGYSNHSGTGIKLTRGFDMLSVKRTLSSMEIASACQTNLFRQATATC